ncbi:MFS transporter [Acetobacteraceae bacterium H6797]|nr:MFS transporter [Acetobacteraceae bacterium H6797]
MSQGYGIPSSDGLERDARKEHASGHRISPGEIAAGVVIGRSSEFFDFFVYAIASVLVFPRLFFPQYDAFTGTLYSFAIFPLAFIARPLGSFFFMRVDRKHGRGTKLTLALFLLGGSTAAISFLPGYAQVGALSIWLLAIFRLGQGFALGGAWDGLASLLALNAPSHRRGWYAMMPQLGAPVGFILAGGLFAYISLTLSTEDFLSFGWRYPFFCAFTINVVALFARLRLVATPEFVNMLEKRELRAVRVVETFREQGRNIIIGAFVPLACFALFHLVTVFPLAWIALGLQRDPSEFLLMQMLGAAIALVMICVSGYLADHIGRRNLLAIGAVLIAVFSFCAPWLLGGGYTGQTTFVLVGFALLGLSFGQASGAVASNFDSRFRYTGSAMTSDIAWLVGAGFAPLVALSLSTGFGLYGVAAYLLSGAVCTLLALTTNRHLEMRDG